jgi:hypothetical protein
MNSFINSVKNKIMNKNYLCTWKSEFDNIPGVEISSIWFPVSEFIRYGSKPGIIILGNCKNEVLNLEIAEKYFFVESVLKLIKNENNLRDKRLKVLYVKNGANLKEVYNNLCFHVKTNEAV